MVQIPIQVIKKQKVMQYQIEAKHHHHQSRLRLIPPYVGQAASRESEHSDEAPPVDRSLS